MVAIEQDNPALKNVLPKDYARPALDKTRLGQVVDMVSNIKLGGPEARATDVLGNVYEYFLERFALAEGRKGGEFYTPRSVVRLLVEMLEPYQGRVYDPCCGSSGMFVQSVEFIRAHASGNGNAGRAKGDHFHLWPGVQLHDMAHGQDESGHPWHRGAGSNTETASATTATRTCGPTTSWPIRPSTSPIGVESSCRDDKRWEYGIPPAGNANFAWVQHFLYHLAPRGIAGFVLANGSMSSNQSGEGRDTQEHHRGWSWWTASSPCRASSSGPLRYLPASGSCAGGAMAESKVDETLFIDVRKLGHMLDRTRRDLSQEDIARIAGTYHAWRGGKDAGEVRRRPRLLQERDAGGDSANTATCSPPAATSARRRRRRTANLSRKRWLASPLSGGSSRPKHGGWTRRSETNLARLGVREDRGHPMKLDLTPLEDAVAQLEEALDIYNSDLAVDRPSPQEASEGRRDTGVRVHLRALIQDAEDAIWSLPRLIRQRSTSSSSTTLSVKPTGKLCSGLNSLRGLSFAGTAARPVTPTTKRRRRRCSRASPDFLQEARLSPESTP